MRAGICRGATLPRSETALACRSFEVRLWSIPIASESSGAAMSQVDWSDGMVRLGIGQYGGSSRERNWTAIRPMERGKFGA